MARIHLSDKSMPKGSTADQVHEAVPAVNARFIGEAIQVINAIR
jgi:hypothetical protein